MRTFVWLTEDARDLLRDAGGGRISDGIQKLVICACLIKELDGKNFDRGFRILCRSLETMAEMENEPEKTPMQVFKDARDELAAQIKTDEALLYAKKLKLGLKEMTDAVSDEQ